MPLELTSDSAGLPHEFAPGDTQEAKLSEVGWSPAARIAAARARRLSRISSGQRDGQKSSLTSTDKTAHNITQVYGANGEKTIRTALTIRRGVTTRTTPEIRSSFFSNDGRYRYEGTTLGMRQKIMKWAKDNGKALPAQFENRSPSAIRGMFRGMSRGGYFGSKIASKSRRDVQVTVPAV